MGNHAQNIILETGALEAIEDSTLFYPCSGEDWREPLKFFGPWCSDFWFVDNEDFMRQPLEVPPAVFLPERHELVIPDGDSKNEERYDDQRPSFPTATYCHRESARVIRVHWYPQDGQSALETQIDRLGVFFYRGDGGSEGGSGIEWLTSPHQPDLVHKVLEKLIDRGLIVTDGSNCGGGDHNPYRQLRGLRENRTITAENAVKNSSGFQDDEGRSFYCIGCLGQYRGYGPTMVWQVRHVNDCKS